MAKPHNESATTNGAANRRGPSGRACQGAHASCVFAHDLQSPLRQPWRSRLGRQFHALRYASGAVARSGPDEAPLNLDTAVEELEVVADDARLVTAVYVYAACG